MSDILKKIYNAAYQYFRAQYKCGVFYKNLAGRVDPNGNFEPLTFIGALPDVLNKPKIQNSAEIRETFGDLKKKQFRIQDECEEGEGELIGNARCYAAVSFKFITDTIYHEIFDYYNYRFNDSKYLMNFIF